MKASQKQINLAKELAKEVEWLVSTNDLYSPSHWNLNEEASRIIVEKYIIDENVQEEVINLITDGLNSFLTAIRIAT